MCVNKTRNKVSELKITFRTTNPQEKKTFRMTDLKERKMVWHRKVLHPVRYQKCIVE